MKHLFFIVSLFLLFSCSPKEAPLQAGHYRIHGELTNLENGILFLSSYQDGVRSLDTLTVEAGKFTYEGTLSGRVKAVNISTTTNPQSQDPMARIYVEPSVMKFTADAKNLATFSLTGSKTQDDAQVLTQLRNKVADKFKPELAAFEANRKLYDAATTEEDKKKYKWKDDDLRTALEPYYTEGAAVVKQFIVDHPRSYISLENLLFVLEEFTQEEAMTVLENFKESYNTDLRYTRTLKEINDMSKGIPGAMAGDFNTTDINGKAIALADFKGQYLLIDFWASWCVPCRKGNPHLLDVYAKYKSKGLEILGVSDDDSNHDAWRKAVKEDNIGVWRHVLRGLEIDRSNGGYKIINDGISGGYNISTLPTKILVGPDGIIIGRYGGGGEDDAAMDKKLAELFGN